MFAKGIQGSTAAKRIERMRSLESADATLLALDLVDGDSRGSQGTERKTECFGYFALEKDSTLSRSCSGS